MQKLLTTTAAFFGVVLTGGLWIGLAARAGDAGGGTVLVLVGALFSLAFLWHLFLRLRKLLSSPRRLLEATLLLLNFALLVATFAWVHQRLGLLEVTGSTVTLTRDFGDALYFSVITITTVGYGDVVPTGAGRPIAAMQGMVGYVILGIVVSTGFQLLAPHTEPSLNPEPRDERNGAESDRQPRH